MFGILIILDIVSGVNVRNVDIIVKFSFYFIYFRKYVFFNIFLFIVGILFLSFYTWFIVIIFFYFVLMYF
jgi:hypothetical protein